MRSENVVPYTQESINYSSFVFRYSISTRSKLIYTLIILSIVVTIISLPFINIKISVKSNAVIGTPNEKSSISSPVNGHITSVLIQENQNVAKGQVLFTIDSKLTDQESSQVKEKISNNQEIIRDLKLILHAVKDGTILPSLPLVTGQYAASWQEYVAEISIRKSNIDQAEKLYKRYNLLYQQKVISTAEYEKYKFDYDQSVSAEKLISNQYTSKWQNDYARYINERIQIKGEENAIKQSEKLYTVKAPVNGSVQGFLGINVGNYVSANQKMMELSPSSPLIAICYIKPSDIGLIKKGQITHFQIESFNYNQWGLVEGKVIEISNDVVTFSDGIALFKVKCCLNRKYLKLKNGYKGYLKKGMSAKAHFMITKRSLYQLLYDKVDDWLNPST